MIRGYRDSDLVELLNVWESASRVGHPFLSDQFLATERTSISTVYLPVAETWVWQEDDRIVGFVSLLGNEVGALFVDPERHGRGIGRALLDHCRDLRGELVVEVFQANLTGLRFYERFGFRRIETKIHPPTGLDLVRLALE